MRSLIFTIVLSISLSATCLKVGISSGQSCNQNSIKIDNINHSFTTKMQVSDSYLTLVDIPIYLYSDVEEEVTMSIRKISSLKNFTNEVIETQFYYIPIGSSAKLIKENLPFTLLLRGKTTKREGNRQIGTIRIEAKNLSDMQTAGTYQLSYNLTVNLGTTLSSTSILSCRGEVEQITRIGFQSLSTYKRGKGFLDSSINYGTFKTHQSNIEKRDIYVKNNVDKRVEVKFQTSDLINQTDSSYRIRMDYFYREKSGLSQPIKNNTSFTIIEGKNSGIIPVGEMIFKTEPIKDSLVAGEYKAILYIKISAN